jgi:hypothetical protein
LCGVPNVLQDQVGATTAVRTTNYLIIQQLLQKTLYVLWPMIWFAGISLSWSAVTKCVTLRHHPSGAALVATPCGRMAFSSSQHCGDIDLFADLATPQPQIAATPAAGDSASATGAAAASAAAADGFAAGVLPLLEVCGQEQTCGLLGVDLCCGEAVIAEAGGCRLHQAPGALLQCYTGNHRSTVFLVEKCSLQSGQDEAT